ncbi:retrotransposon hot spot (RHS) protein, putative, partial [Trypanosoma cruzi]
MVCMIWGPCMWPLLHRIFFPLLFVSVSDDISTSSRRVCAVTAVPHGCG